MHGNCTKIGRLMMTIYDVYQYNTFSSTFNMTKIFGETKKNQVVLCFDFSIIFVTANF